MKIFTQSLAFITHTYGATAAFLTCRNCIFNSSVIPELLSDEDLSSTYAGFLGALRWYEIFALSDTMQFASNMTFAATGMEPEELVENVLQPLLTTKRYFSTTLQSCSIFVEDICNALIPQIAQVKTLSYLCLGNVHDEGLALLKQHFAGHSRLESLTIVLCNVSNEAIADFGSNSFKLPRVKKIEVNSWCGTAEADSSPFFAVFPNLTSLRIDSSESELNVETLCRDCPKLAEIDLSGCTFSSSLDSIGDLTDLRSLSICTCELQANESPSLQFLTSPNLQQTLAELIFYTNSGLGLAYDAQHVQNLIHLRKLAFIGVEGAFEGGNISHLGNLTALEELNLSRTGVNAVSLLNFQRYPLVLNVLCRLALDKCSVGGSHHHDHHRDDETAQKASSLSGLYRHLHSLTMLEMCKCDLVDDDLSGIGKLKETLQHLEIGENSNLNSAGLNLHLAPLVKLVKLHVQETSISDSLNFLKGMRNLTDLNLSGCDRLVDSAFQVFSEDPNSFPELRTLDMSCCDLLTDVTFVEHLARNNNLKFQLKRLDCYENPNQDTFEDSPISDARVGVFELFKGLQHITLRLKGEARQLVKLRLQKKIKDLTHVF